MNAGNHDYLYRGIIERLRLSGFQAPSLRAGAFQDSSWLAAHESGLDKEFISDIHKNAPDVLRELYLSSHVVRYAIKAQNQIIRKIADNGSCVIVGRAADYVLRDYDHVVRVFVHAPKEYRIGKVMEIYGDSLREANQHVRRSDKARASYYRHISGKRWGDARNYELTVDSSIGNEQAAERILGYIADNRCPDCTQP